MGKKDSGKNVKKFITAQKVEEYDLKKVNENHMKHLLKVACDVNEKLNVLNQT